MHANRYDVHLKGAGISYWCGTQSSVTVIRHPSSPPAWVIKRQGVMKQDLFRNTVATNALSAGRPPRNPKPMRRLILLVILVGACLAYYVT